MHEKALVAESARLGEGVTVDVGACVEAGAVLGDRVWVGAGAYGARRKIGDDTEVKPGAAICHQAEIGRRCTIHPNATIGADGFGFAPVLRAG